jgi:hypothetical protein
MIYGSQQIGNTNAGVAYIPLAVMCKYGEPWVQTVSVIVCIWTG